MTGEVFASRRTDWAIYILTLLLVGRQALAYLWWGMVEIGVRLGVWPPDLLALDVYGYYDQVTVLHETVFIIAAAGFVTALIATLRRSRWAPHILIACLVPGISDWVLLTTIPQMVNDLSGYLHLIGHLVAICGLLVLRRRNFLR